MITLRCTQKLLKRLGGPAAEVRPSTTVLGDWYANVISLPFRGKSVVMFVNEHTLLSVLIPGRGTKKMLPVFKERTVALLEKINLPSDSITKETREMADLQLAPTDSRSVLGSMNDMARHLQAVAERKSTAAAMNWDAQEWLFTEYPHGPLEGNFPREVAAERFRSAA